MSFCAASCCTCFPKASSAFATSAFSPTGGGPLSCHFAGKLSQWFSRELRANRFACRRSSALSHTLELPCLRRDHARRRAALRGSTSSASLATASWIRCCMKPHLHPRPVHLLRHACSHCVSPRSDYPPVHLFGIYLAQEHEACRHHLPLPATCTTRYSHPANLQAILRPIQST